MFCFGKDELKEKEKIHITYMQVVAYINAYLADTSSDQGIQLYHLKSILAELVCASAENKEIDFSDKNRFETYMKKRFLTKEVEVDPSTEIVFCIRKPKD